MSDRPINLIILGSTGSIGEQALQVVDLHPDKFKVVGLAARDEVDVLAQQAEKYQPRAVALGDEKYYGLLKMKLSDRVRLLVGTEGMCELASLEDVDIVLVAVSGAVGIRPTLAAIKKSRRIALANKETLVAAGDLVMNLASKMGSMIIPVDSEHSAIFQCLAGESKFLRNLWVTASGGPFRDFDQEQLGNVTVEMALKHPNWKMGPKITIDSATLMNKGLEVIEAHHLFSVDYDHIQVLVQKESVIHSMVELVDGSFLGHLGVADMRIPIQYALTYPERFESPAAQLDFSQLGCIHFQKPDTGKFPLLRIAYEAGREGGTMPAVMNAANEVAVNHFLNRDIGFMGITASVIKVMEKHDVNYHPDLEDTLLADAWAREFCQSLIVKGDI
ncbi:MAG: 1-deoxy-D-xylulose-5-phosphate reductoisomerase [Syntrophomonas sp.]|nr:1-deoxy-D-xylulose-5-phosphate reductoisomerase [Syntrophomonas sp.]